MRGAALAVGDGHSESSAPRSSSQRAVLRAESSVLEATSDSKVES